MSVLLGLLSALCWGFHDLLVRLISQRFHILSTLCVVFAISCAGLAGKLVYSSLSIDIPLEVGILHHFPGRCSHFRHMPFIGLLKLDPFGALPRLSGHIPSFPCFGQFLQGRK